MNKLILKKGREKAILRHHPWIFSGAIKTIEGNPGLGETIAVHDVQGQFLAWAAYSPNSQIRSRIWTWDENQAIDQSFFRERISAAIKLRETQINSSKTNAYRLIHAESDNLPGLIVDRYDNALVMQILSAGIERWRENIVEILVDLIHPDCIYERSDVAVRELEGLNERTGILFGELPQQPMMIKENDQILGGPGNRAKDWFLPGPTG